MNWGKRIIIAFIGFFGVIFTLAYISIGQDLNLVADDYYVQELAYEDQIQRIKNTEGLALKPTVVLDKRASKAHLVFPETLMNKVEEGQLHFFRPANGTLDKKYAIALNDKGMQSFDLSGFPQGRWKAKITWSYHNKEYYQEIDLLY